MGLKDNISIIFLICIFVASLLLLKPDGLNVQKELQIGVPIHTHALLNITICGQHFDLPKATQFEDNGEPFRGTALLHTHDDNIIHIEGLIQKKEDIALGRFFDAIEIPFDKDKLMDVKTGDLCDGKPGVLKMYVNDQPRTDFRDYILASTQDARQQVIKLVFEAE